MSSDTPDPTADETVARYDLYGNALTTDDTFGSILPPTIIRTHGPAVCHGQTCALHNPSAHALHNAPMVFRTDKHFLIERTCEHGIGHPDPDSLAHLQRTGIRGHGTHGCDGCCHTPTDDRQSDEGPQPR